MQLRQISPRTVYSKYSIFMAVNWPLLVTIIHTVHMETVQIKRVARKNMDECCSEQNCGAKICVKSRT